MKVLIFNMEKLLALDVMKGAELLVKGDHFYDTLTGTAIIDDFTASKGKQGRVGLVINADVSYLFDCIERLKNSGLYGVMVEKPNKALIEACRSKNMTLIDLEDGKRYIEILQAINDSVLNVHARRGEYLKSCHSMFYNATGKGEGNVDEMIRLLSDILETTVITYYISGKIGSTGRYEPKPGALVLEEGDALKVGEYGDKYIRQRITVSGETMEGIAVSFEVLRRVYGKLFIKLSEGRRLSAIDRFVIETAMMAITLETTKELAVSEIEQRLKNDLLSDLITGNISSENNALIRAQSVGWNMAKPYAAVVFRFRTAVQKNKSDLATTIRSLRIRLTELMDEKLGSGDGRIIGVAGDTINVLWPYDTEKSYNANAEDIRQVFTKLFEVEKDKFGIISYSGGIGSRTDSLRGIEKSYDDALNAIKYGTIIDGDDHMYDINGIGVYRFIGRMGSKEELASFIPPSLQKLVEYDSASKNVLVNTLDVYLSCDCNLGKASQLLGIHYKSLVYRVSRIKEIMELENIEGDVRLEIQLALKMLKILSFTEKEEK